MSAKIGRWRGASSGRSRRGPLDDPIDDDALPQLRAATDPAAKGGEFYGPVFVNNGPPVRKPILRRVGMDRAVPRLWEVSERETGVALDPRTPAAA